MKLIIATIQPEKLDAVQAALQQAGSPVVHTGEVLDLREQSTGMYRGVEYRAARAKLRLEVLVENDVAVEDTIQAISAAASLGEIEQRRNGNIFVMPVERWVPIRSRERRLMQAVPA